LIGENRDTTVIDGNGSGDVIHLDIDGVYISGFTLQNDVVKKIRRKVEGGIRESS